MFDFIDLFLVMGFAWAITGAVGLIFNKRKDSGSTFYGVLLLIIFSLVLADNFVKPGMLPHSAARLFYIPSRNVYFLIGPALWFYTRSLLDPGHKPGTATLLHLLPFLIWCAYLSTLPRPAMPLRPGIIPPDSTAFILSRIRDISSVIIQLVYSLLVFFTINRHRKESRDFYSSINFRDTLSWLTVLVIIYSVIYVSDGILFFAAPSIGRIKAASAILTRIVPPLLFIFFFSLFARDQEIPEDRKPEKDATADGDKYRKSSLSEHEAVQLYHRLTSRLEQEKSYTDAELTLDTLAAELGETRHRLSETINRVSGDSFYNMINTYRLEEFKTSLSENRYPEYTIIAVAFECGFKSASAFYSVFKKETGITPKEYLKQIPNQG